MKKVILFYYEGQDESSFLSSSRDECNQPYVDFRDYLLDIGIKLEMTPNRPLEDYMYICFWNMYSVKAFNVISKMKRSAASFVEGRGVTSIYQKCVKKGLKEKMVLFLSEPASVVPENYVTQDHYNFSYIFTWSSKLLNRDRHLYKYFNIPTNFSSQRCDKFSFDRKKLLVDISGNKYSKHPRELYSGRRKDIQYFEKKIPNEFDLYGFNWGTIKPYDKHLYASYRGVALSKKDVFSKYKFAICYENIHDEENYISNRIFDIFTAGCIPIYWGGAYINDFIDQSTFINREDFETNELLVDHLISMTEYEHTVYLENINSYLASSKSHKFSSKAFFENFTKTLELRL